MYKCPIELITTQIHTEIENEIFKAVQEVGVNVDKDELVKALQYDREQYNKGYEDGVRDFINNLQKIPIGRNIDGFIISDWNINNIAQRLTNGTVKVGD